MKRIIIKLMCVGLFIVSAFPLNAQYATDFTVTEVENSELKAKMSVSISQLLTAINIGQFANAIPNFENTQVTLEAREVIRKLWADCPFRCAENEVVERGRQMPRGEWQVRNIPLIMMPVKENQISWKKYQEGVVTLNARGEVIDFHLAVNPELYIKVMRGAKNVDDFVQRQLILEYVERFRNAYCLKDIEFLRQVFSEDALIITGKVIKAVKSDMNVNNKKVVYSRQSKKQYLSRLEKIFKRNKHINVNFDEINVVKHPAKENFYGVTLKQGYTSDYYSDEGYVFLLWDFTDIDAPKIHVRTWQPDKIDVGTPLPEEEIFSIDDFDI